MFSWVSRDARRRKEPELFRNVSEGLKQLYAGKLLPLEEHYRFHDFHSPALEPADWESKPMVLLVGQYSTGKTTFIRHLLEQDFPGMRIGPEPTTDSFIAVMGGESEGVIPGNALVVDPRRPFRKLNAFGNAFLNRDNKPVQGCKQAWLKYENVCTFSAVSDIGFVVWKRTLQAWDQPVNL
ncbi:hypothetical protein Chor_014912 [Crotalus horridus]